MAKKGKNFETAKSKVEEKLYSLQDAIPLVQSIKFAKFDESVELAMRLGVNPKHADQMVRGPSTARCSVGSVAGAFMVIE